MTAPKIDDGGPESTGVYACPKCPNITQFIGLDDHGYPGENCECGAYGEGGECVCHVTLRQPFTVLGPGEVDYQCHDGGYDSEIGSYTSIECAECGAVIWAEGRANG